MEWEVAEMVKEIRRQKGELSQAAFAEFLNLRDPKPKDKNDIRFVRTGDIQRLESAGRNLRKQFVIFLKLVPLCVESGLLGAHDLLSPEKYELYKRLESSESAKVEVYPRRKAKHV